MTQTGRGNFPNIIHTNNNLYRYASLPDGTNSTGTSINRSKAEEKKTKMRSYGQGMEEWSSTADNYYVAFGYNMYVGSSNTGASCTLATVTVVSRVLFSAMINL